MSAAQLEFIHSATGRQPITQLKFAFWYYFAYTLCMCKVFMCGCCVHSYAMRIQPGGRGGGGYLRIS